MIMLLQKRYILSFESGVIVIKHWRINNYLRDDRHKNTTYVEEMETLALDQKGSYTEKDKLGIPTSNQVPTVMGIPSIDKNSIDKDSINNKTFKKPTVDEVRAYCKERNNNVDPETFVDFYESKNWMIGKNKMKDWKAAVRTWERSDKNKSKDFSAQKVNKFNNFDGRKYNFDDLEDEVFT